MFSEQLKQDLKNPWLRSILTVVGVTLVVNIGFITYAYMFPPNLVVNNYYERGKEYFHDEKQRQQAEASAWRLQLLMPNKMHVDQRQTVRLYVMDHQGKPVQEGTVTLKAYRPDDSSRDFSLNLPLSDVGTFSAPLSFPLLGRWDVIARIDTDSHHFDTSARIFVEQ
ncbi:MAG: FixH family protein [Mariprofundaceae bacterium]